MLEANRWKTCMPVFTAVHRCLKPSLARKAFLFHRPRPEALSNRVSRQGKTATKTAQ